MSPMGAARVLVELAWRRDWAALRRHWNVVAAGLLWLFFAAGTTEVVYGYTLPSLAPSGPCTILVTDTESEWVDPMVEAWSGTTCVPTREVPGGGTPEEALTDGRLRAWVAFDRGSITGGQVRVVAHRPLPPALHVRLSGDVRRAVVPRLVERLGLADEREQARSLETVWVNAETGLAEPVAASEQVAVDGVVVSVWSYTLLAVVMFWVTRGAELGAVGLVAVSASSRALWVASVVAAGLRGLVGSGVAACLWMLLVPFRWLVRGGVSVSPDADVFTRVFTTTLPSAEIVPTLLLTWVLAIGSAALLAPMLAVHPGDRRLRREASRAAVFVSVWLVLGYALDAVGVPVAGPGGTAAVPLLGFCVAAGEVVGQSNLWLLAAPVLASLTALGVAWALTPHARMLAEGRR